MTTVAMKAAARQSLRALLPRGAGLVAGTACVTIVARLAGMPTREVVSSTIFISIVLATLLFWQFRLAIAFMGVAVLLSFRVLTIERLIISCQLDVILFLVGMMVIVAVLKELGLFTWLIQGVISAKKMTGTTFIAILVVLAALSSCVVDEVTSIVFISALVFQVCDTLKLDPRPFIIISVFATNIGSSGTMLGNPVGIMIGSGAGLTFEDFALHAFPIMIMSLAACLALVMILYRKDIALLSERIDERRRAGQALGPLLRIPYRQALVILALTMVAIAAHSRIEKLLGLETNTALKVIPLLVAGILMIWRRNRARHYIEHDVEWWTLLFFMMLFAVAGTLEHTGVTARIARGFLWLVRGNNSLLAPAILGVSMLGSAFVDNVIFVAAFMPIVRELHASHLWWALLFGACFGGNITLIGSTANIVALGLVEKRYRTQIGFLKWLWAGLVVAAGTGLVAWLGIALDHHLFGT